MTQVKAQLNGLRIAPRKVRAVTNLVKGKDVVYGLSQMEFLMKRSVLPLIKLLNSAIANAENNFSMVRENLYIKDFVVDEGIKLKRYRPKAQGRSGEIQKKTSKVRLILDERVVGLKRQASPGVDSRDGALVRHGNSVEKKVKEKTEIVSQDVIKTETKKHEIKTEIGKRSDTSSNAVKRLFRRKQV